MSCVSHKHSSQRASGLSRLSTRSGTGSRASGTLQASRASPPSDGQKLRQGLPPLAPGPLPGSAPRLTAEVLSKLDRESRRSGTASARLVAAMGSAPSQQQQLQQQPQQPPPPPLRQPQQRGVSLPPLPRTQRLMAAASAEQADSTPSNAPSKKQGRSSSPQPLQPLPRRRPRRNGPVQSLDWQSKEAWRATDGVLMRAYAARVEKDAPTIPCPHCGRKFREEALATHARVCVNVFGKQRKAFDAQRQRMPPGALRRRARIREVKLVNNWRQQSRALRLAMRAARRSYHARDRFLGPTSGEAAGLDGRIPCPHCGRKFGENQAARHIPVCRLAAASLVVHLVRGARSGISGEALGRVSARRYAGTGAAPKRRQRHPAVVISGLDLSIV
eukprot:s1297_g20.t1